MWKLGLLPNVRTFMELVLKIFLINLPSVWQEDDSSLKEMEESVDYILNSYHTFIMLKVRI